MNAVKADRGYRNGYRERKPIAGIGTPSLRIPQIPGKGVFRRVSKVVFDAHTGLVAAIRIFPNEASALVVMIIESEPLSKNTLKLDSS